MTDRKDSRRDDKCRKENGRKKKEKPWPVLLSGVTQDNAVTLFSAAHQKRRVNAHDPVLDTRIHPGTSSSSCCVLSTKYTRSKQRRISQGKRRHTSGRANAL